MTTIAELAKSIGRCHSPSMSDATPRKAKMPKSPPKPKKYHTFEITLRGPKDGDNGVVRATGQHMYVTARGDLLVCNNDPGLYGSHKTVFTVHTGGWKFARQLDDVIDPPAEPAT